MTYQEENIAGTFIEVLRTAFKEHNLKFGDDVMALGISWAVEGCSIVMEVQAVPKEGIDKFDLITKN